MTRTTRWRHGPGERKHPPACLCRSGGVSNWWAILGLNLIPRMATLGSTPALICY